MDGLIVVNKPLGLTSAKAVYRIRRLSGQRKSGHAGTLDPAASGVLLVCLGKGTKLVERLMDLPKHYRTTARFDLTSDSYDLDGVVHAVDAPAQTEQVVREALGQFRGTILQAPPAISAIKVGGRPAYALARAGKPPDLPPRPVRIYSIDLLRLAWPEVELDLRCGRGTYVRALIRDLGLALGVGGCVTALERRAVGPFGIEAAHSLEALVSAPMTEWLIPLERVRTQLTECELQREVP